MAIPIQATVKLGARALAADTTPIPDAPLQWTLGDTLIASFDPVSGLVTGKRAGKTQLVVKGPGSGLSVTWTLRVLAAGVKLSAIRLGLPLNRRYSVRANYVDEGGTVIGPAVNYAARLEKLCGQLDRPVLLSAAMAELLHQNRLHEGQWMALPAVGGGMNYGCWLLRYHKIKHPEESWNPV